MKLLPKQTRVNTGDSLGHGMDAVITLVLFVGAGYGLDRLFGTVPVFMIVMTLLGAVGIFFKFKYRYDERMTELEDQRRMRTNPVPTSAPAAPAAGATAARKIA